MTTSTKTESPLGDPPQASAQGAAGAVKARPRWGERLAATVMALLALAALGGLLRATSDVLAPILLSLLIAYVFDPLIDWFEARRVNRSLAIVVVMSGLVAALALLAIIVLPVLVSEIAGAIAGLPELVRTGYEAVTAWMAERNLSLADFELESAEVASTLAPVASRAQALLTGLVGAAAGSVGSLLNAVLVPVFTFYFLRDFDRIKVKPLVLVPPRYRDGLISRLTRMDRVVGEWVRGQVEVALVLAVLYAVGLALIGLRLGVVIGLVAGLLNAVPYFGAVIGVALSVLMALMNGSWLQLVGVAVVFTVVQGLEGYVITPRLVGEKVGMSPVTVMIVLMLGGSLFGFFGLLLGIPVAAAGSVLMKDALEWYRASRWYLGAQPGDAAAADVSAAAAEASTAADASAAAAAESA